MASFNSNIQISVMGRKDSSDEKGSGSITNGSSSERSSSSEPDFQHLIGGQLQPPSFSLSSSGADGDVDDGEDGNERSISERTIVEMVDGQRLNTKTMHDAFLLLHQLIKECTDIDKLRTVIWEGEKLFSKLQKIQREEFGVHGYNPTDVTANTETMATQTTDPNEST